METRSTRPGGSVYPAKKSTAPGFPLTKAKTKKAPTTYGPHDLYGRAAFPLSPEKKGSRGKSLIKPRPPRGHQTKKNEKRRVKRKKEGEPRKSLKTAAPQRARKKEKSEERKPRVVIEETGP
jgi:hypothetical protein